MFGAIHTSDDRDHRNRSILVTGAAGMVGTAFSRLLGARATELTHSELDIVDEERVRRTMTQLLPALVINCAGATDVDRCESDEQYALAGNLLGPRIVARAAREAGARLVHFSTDYVFDGAKRAPYCESDPCRPLSRYGQTKLEGEEAVRDILPNALIIRTSWIYGPARSPGRTASFPEKVLDWAGRALQTAAVDGRPVEAIRVVSDQKGSPTFSEDLAAAVLALLDREVSGTIHLGGMGCASRYEQAEAVLAAAGLKVPLRPGRMEELHLPAARPAQSCLDSSLALSLGVGLPPWQEGITRFVRGLRA